MSKKKKGASSEKDAGNTSKGGGRSTEDMLYHQSMEARIEGLKSRVEELRLENGRLKAEGSKSEKETHEFVAYFQHQLESKDQQIAKLSDQLAAKDQSFEKQLRETKEESQLKIHQAESALQDTRGLLESRIKVLEDELAVLTEYKHKRDVLNNKLIETEALLKEERAAHRRELSSIERQFIEKSAKVQRDMEKRIESIKLKAKQDAQEGLDQDTKKIIQDNKRMSEELKFQLDTTDDLQQVGKALKEENDRLKRNLSLAVEKEEQYAKSSFFKESELSTARTKIKALERTLAQTVRDFEQAQRERESKHAKEMEDLRMEVQGLKQLVKMKNKELGNVRHLANVILEQRTEVEQYFLEALDQVKKEVAKHREETRKQEAEEYRKQVRLAQRGKVKFPKIRGGINEHVRWSEEGEDCAGDSEDTRRGKTRKSVFGNRIDVQPGVKIELRDLSWEDRERVLRILFAKINKVENQTKDVIKEAPIGSHVLSDQMESYHHGMVPYRPL